MAELDMDKEVMVKVDTDMSGGYYTVFIEALSMDHDISKVELWKGGGVAVRKLNTWQKSDNSLTNQPKAGVEYPTSSDTSKVPQVNNGWGKKDTSHDVTLKHDGNDPGKAGSLQVNDFPILVDVYEEGDSAPGGEPADAHRHGWFDQYGNIQTSKKHPVAKEWETPNVLGDRNHWYGRMPEGEGLGGKDLPEPHTHAEDNK